MHDARGQDASSNLVGRWRVERSALDLPCRLTALEIRKASVSGDLIAVGIQRERPGSERVWGSGKLDRPWEAGRPDRWISAEWTSGPDIVLIQARRLLLPGDHTMRPGVVSGQRVVDTAELVDQILQVLRAHADVRLRLREHRRRVPHER